jgi:hypothetical protein
VGFSKGFEKIAGPIGWAAKGVGKALGAGIRGAGRVMGAGPGAMGALTVGSTLADATTNYKKNKQMALGAMQRM